MPLPHFPLLHTYEELDSIIEADYALNHASREYSCAKVKQLIVEWCLQDKPLFCAPRIAFTLQELGPGIVEFHSINGGTAKQLTAGVEQLLNALAPHYPFAATYYDNPRVNDLLKHVSFPSEFSRINGGEDRTWEAIFHLRSI